MVRWTSSHKIPFDCSPVPAKRARTAVIGDNVWIVGEFYRDSTECVQIAVFDTKTLKATKVDIEAEYTRGWQLESVTNDDNHLYILMKRERRNEEFKNYKLWKFDTRNLKFEDEMRIRARNIVGKPQILGNILHYLDRDSHEESVSIVKMDLVEKVVIATYELAEASTNERLMLHDEKIYWSNLCEGYRVTAHYYEDWDFKLQGMGRDMWMIEEEDDYNTDHICVNDDQMMFYSMLPNKMGQYLFLDTFNYYKKHWQREVVKDFFDGKVPVDPNSIERIGDKTYVIVKQGVDNQASFSVRVLDVEPKLANLCMRSLATLADKERDKTKLDSVMSRLPDDLKSTLEILTKSRIRRYC